MRNVPQTKTDGIVCYIDDVAEDYADYHATGLDNLYATEKDHFWFIGRREKIIATFNKFVPRTARILEIGAGTGYVAQGLQGDGYKVAVGEIHLPGLRYAMQNGIEECYQFDLFDPPFEDEFDAVGMFDVLEHLENDVHALSQVSKMLKPDGRLIVTVPAHNWLWNRYDTVADHRRRYSRKLLMQTVERAGLEVLEASFYFIAILPLLYLRHVLHRDNKAVVAQHERDEDIHINPTINKMLLGLTRLENRFSKWLPEIAGGSLLLVAQKSRVTRDRPIHPV